MRSDSFLEVNLKNLKYNLSLIQEKTSQEIILMVKADAYGHGLLVVSKYAYESCGIRNFGVADIGEAKQLFEFFDLNLIKNINIYCFSNPSLDLEEYRSLYTAGSVIPVLESLKAINSFYDLKINESASLVIKLDTGMNRLGINIENLDELITILQRNNVSVIDHLMTHFSNSYLPLKANDKTNRQLVEFDSIIEELKSKGIEVKNSSCSNSGAIEQGLEKHHTHIRPGLMAYGPQSYFDKKNTIIWEGKNLSTFRSRVLKIIQAKQGSPIGYGSTVTNASGTIIYLPLGYGDGFLTYYSGAKIKINGIFFKVFGRVNMDLCALFTEEICDFAVGDKVEIWHEKNYCINEFAIAVKTSPYQVMCAVSQRIKRIYL